jgi:hypothetical protein
MTLGAATEHVLLLPSSSNSSKGGDPLHDHQDDYDSGCHDDTSGNGMRLVPKLNATITGPTGQHPELVLQLFEHKQRHNKKVLRCTLRVPTASLMVTVTPSSSRQPPPQPTQLRVPIPNGGYLQLEAIVREWETPSSGAHHHYDTPASSSQQQLRSYNDNDLYEAQLQRQHLLVEQQENQQHPHYYYCGGWEWMLCLQVC